MQIPEDSCEKSMRIYIPWKILSDALKSNITQRRSKLHQRHSKANESQSVIHLV